MSALRKLRALREKSKQQPDAADMDEEPDDLDTATPEPKENAFAFLEEDDDQAEDEDNEDNNGAVAEELTGKESQELSNAPSAQSGNASNKKKKKKQKKKAKKKPLEASGGVSAAAAPSLGGSRRAGGAADGARDDEDLDFLDDLASSHIADSNNPGSGSESKGSAADLLHTTRSYFNADLEIKRVFGSSVLRMSREENEPEHAGRRGAARPARLRRLVLSRIDNDAPVHLPTHIVMTSQAQRMGLKFFQFEYTRDYENMQRAYEECVASLDPQQIGYFLRRHPFHVDALLQMAQILLHHGELVDSALLVERCLFVFEKAFLPDFTFLEANCRLDYSRHENVGFFRALSHHCRFLARKGCPRTALEYSKLLLSLSPRDDPMCVLVNLDYYALRAKEYAWLLEMFASFEDYSIPVRLLPTFAFSGALTRWFLESGGKGPGGFGIAPGSISVNMDLRSASASQLLQRALLLYPEALQPLVKKGNEKEAAKPAWRSIFAHTHFRNGEDRMAVNKYINKLVNIFAERHGNIWKPDKMVTWLQQHAVAVARKIESGEQKPEDLRLLESQRDFAFNGPLPDRLRQLMPYEYSDAPVPPLPAELLMGQAAGMERQRPDDGYVHLDLGQLQGGNPLVEFFRTLLPWVHVEQEYDADRGEWVPREFPDDDEGDA